MLFIPRNAGAGREHILLVNGFKEDWQFVDIEMARAICSMKDYVFDLGYETSYQQVILKNNNKLQYYK